MRILIASGIWPPDVGGPASHAPNLGQYLVSRGHDVHAVTSTPHGSAEDFGFPVHALSRAHPRVMRLPALAAAIVRGARRADVVYTTGVYTRSAVACGMARVPMVARIVCDPAFERSRTLGLFSGGVEEFQARQRDPRILLLKRNRDLALRRATRFVVTGQFLAELVLRWGLREERVQMVANPAANVDRSVPRDDLRRRFGLDGFTFVFAGRFVRQKNLPLVIRAFRQVPEASLVLLGDGPERGSVESAIAEAGVGGRVTLAGSVSQPVALDWMRAADAAVLASDWEGAPHAAAEALALGTPLIATAVGALPQTVDSGVDGLLVGAGDERAFAQAMSSVAADPGLLARLRAGAARTGDRFAPERIFATIEAQIVRAAADGRRGRPSA